MFFAIITTTYKRSDGKTPFYLRRALDSVFSQTYKNFRIFVIGDNYEDSDELFDVCSEYDQKYIYSENLSRPSERDMYKDVPNAVWSYGGCDANNYAIQKAIDLGFSYICHLDHDDYWDPDHLREIKNCIDVTRSPWICTLSLYQKNHSPFPRITWKNKRHNENHEYVEYQPHSECVIHSSTCINYKEIPIRQTDVYKETGKVGLPGDAYTWERMREWLTENEKKSYLIEKVTCMHIEEGFEKSNTKK